MIIRPTLSIKYRNQIAFGNPADVYIQTLRYVTGGDKDSIKFSSKDYTDRDKYHCIFQPPPPHPDEWFFSRHKEDLNVNMDLFYYNALNTNDNDNNDGADDDKDDDEDVDTDEDADVDEDDDKDDTKLSTDIDVQGQRYASV